jgi:hypothetical protein
MRRTVSTSKSKNSEAAIWQLIVNADAPMSRDAAARILTLSIPEEIHRRLAVLAERNRNGALTPEEQAEFDNCLRVGTTLSILKSKARKILKPRRRAS